MSFDPTDDTEELFPDTEIKSSDEEEADPEESVVEKASPAARKLEPIVLAHVLGPKYQPVKPRVIARQLNLPSDQHKALKLAIRRLVKAGKLDYGSGHLVRAPKAGTTAIVATARRESDVTRRLTPPARQDSRTSRDSKNVIVGTFRRTSKGFGFVRPQGAPRGDKTGDIYIAAGATMDASDRDVVRVRLSRSKARGKGGVLRQAGEIVEI